MLSFNHPLLKFAVAKNFPALYDLTKIFKVLGAVGKVKKHKQTSGRMFLKMRHSRRNAYVKNILS
jgi:hypothetical protein